ncbi:MAG: hypothetical protein ACREVZ_04960, partial [Burkholderiales bacterium]
MKLLLVCFGGSRSGVSSDGLPYLSNFYCLPGKAGGSPADARGLGDSQAGFEREDVGVASAELAQRIGKA